MSSNPTLAGALPASPNKGPVGPLKDWIAKAAGPPIDYSFKELKLTTDVLFEEPVAGHPAHPILSLGAPINEYLESLCAHPDSPAVTSPKSKLNSNSLRICNNALASLKSLDKVMPHLLEDPSELTWLDASCNQLTSIEDVVSKFPKLQVLYLHGNLINNLHDVQTLAKLEHLQKLTLHGNPMAEKAEYKMWVCAHLPQLRSLDFSTITKVERDKVSVWHRGYLKHQRAH